MQQTLTTKIKGLYTSDNALSSVPDGALLVADDVVIDRVSIAEPRRGFDRLPAGFATSADRALQLFVYQGKLLAHTSANQIQYWDGMSWTALSGTHTKPTNAVRVRAVEANQNLYVTTNAGVVKLDVFSATPVAAGAFKALGITASIPSVPTGAWLADGHRVTYRGVWGYKDSNGNVILGAPSQRETVRNAAGSDRDVSIVVTIPAGVTTSWFFQLYRSTAVDDTTGDIENSDELGLVYETNPSEVDLAAGYLTIVDIVPDALRGATIYTATSQEGIAKQNEQPPLAGDIAVFRDHLFFADLAFKHRFYLTLLATGSPSGVQVDDTVVIDGVTYTAKMAETAASAQFRAYTSGSFTFVDGDVDTGNETITETGHPLQDGDAVTLSNNGGALPGGLSAATTYYVVSRAANTFKLAATPGGSAINISSAVGGGTHTLTYGGTPAQNIRDTALSLVRVINTYASSTVYAYYLSGSGETPGKLMLEARTLGSDAFACTSSRATCWSPTLPSSGTSQSSTNDSDPAGIAWTKPGQPESQPLPYRSRAGSKAKRALRIVALRDSLFILKEDGIFRLTGTDASNFAIELFDSSTRLLAPETCAVLGNVIYALSDQGVVSISETGVSIVSSQIEDDLKAIFGMSLAAVAAASFGVSYESDRKYILWTISSADDTFATQAFVYNALTGCWTRWRLAKRCGIVNPSDDRLYLGESASQFVNRERKSYDETDHVDFFGSANITNVSGDQLTVTLDALIDSVEVGDVLFQSDTVFGIVTSVDTIAATATVSAPADFTEAACDILKAIDARITFAAVSGGNAGLLKQFHTAILLFESDYVGTAEIGFTSDLDRSEDLVEAAGAPLANWGLFGWGEGAWGGENGVTPRRVWVPRRKQVCSQLTVSFRHRVGFSSWELAGLALHYNAARERVSR